MSFAFILGWPIIVITSGVISGSTMLSGLVDKICHQIIPEL